MKILYFHTLFLSVFRALLVRQKRKTHSKNKRFRVRQPSKFQSIIFLAGVVHESPFYKRQTPLSSIAYHPPSEYSPP